MIIFGYTIKYDKDIAEFWLSLLSLLTTIGTLYVTYFFTKQLVKNDNEREKRAERDRLLEKFKTTLRPYATKNDGNLQRTGVRLLVKNPAYIALIFEAFDDIHHENPEKNITLEKFENLMYMQADSWQLKK